MSLFPLEEPVDVDRLRADVDELERWSADSTFETNGYHDGYATCLLHHGGHYTSDGLRLRWLLDRFAPLVAARATRLRPGGYIAPHEDSDQGCIERWQIPVVVAGEFVVEGEPVEQVPGRPWLVPYERTHALFVPPDAPEARLVVLVDRTPV